MARVIAQRLISLSHQVLIGLPLRSSLKRLSQVIHSWSLRPDGPVLNGVDSVELPMPKSRPQRRRILTRDRVCGRHIDGCGKEFDARTRQRSAT